MNNANNKVISLKMLSYLRSTTVILFFQKEDLVLLVSTLGHLNIRLHQCQLNSMTFSKGVELKLIQMLTNIIPFII